MPFNPNGLSSSDITEINTMYPKFIERVVARDWDRFLELYSEDTVVMPPSS